MIKRISTLLAICLIGLNSSANKNIKSTISQVTVFLTGAQIDRVSSAKLNKGMNHLVYYGLSDRINAKSIQVNANNNVRIVSTTVGSEFVTEEQNNYRRIALVTDSILKLNRKLKEITYKTNTYRSEISMLHKNDQIGRGDNGMSVEELKNLSTFYSSRLMLLNKNIFEQELKDADYKIKKAKYEAELSRLKRKGGGKTFHYIKVVVQTKEATTSKIKLKYLVGNAGWAPKYDIHVQNTANEIKMGYQAHVMNKSGENWNNMNITLSTSTPSNSIEIPRLEDWKVGKNYRADNSGNNSGVTQTVPKAVAQQQSDLTLLDGVEYAEIEISGIDVEFKIKEKYTIPTDGKIYLVDIVEYNLPASFKYYSIPKMDKDAYLLGQITGWEKLNLIEGNANVYLRGNFVGETYIKPGFANDTLNISLGRDSKVFVSRNRVDEKTTKSIIGNHKKEVYTYILTVRNTNPNAITLDLIDQIPISTDDQVSINIIELSEGKKDDYNGQIDWKVDLKPGEVKKYTLSFSMKYPKNMKMDNNRRANYYRKSVRAKF